jgi:hypothetical protein
MEVHKFYDACCHKCGNWYTSRFKALHGLNKDEAIKVMKKNGWGTVAGKTYCNECY